MPDSEPDDELFASALAGANDCPPLEDLERLLGEDAPALMKRHVDGCPNCRTELQMLRSFTSSQVAPQERAAVDEIAARLKTSSAPREERQPWWKQLFAPRWLTPVAAALALVMLAAGVTIELRRRTQPALDTSAGGSEVLRSPAIAILSPVGDLQNKPSGIRWEPAPNAARYRVRIMEVDRGELWSAETTATLIELPPVVENLIVPAKTLLIQVTALDAAGSRIAESEPVRFRLLQKLYTH